MTSIDIRTPIVNETHMKYPIQAPKTVAEKECASRAGKMVFSRKTAASCPCARESAQRRRYEAVLEIVPRTNSMVSIS